MKNPHIIIITGTSGGGKDSVVKELLSQDPHIHRVVTHTDRAMREGEVADVDYHFVPKTEFEQMIAQNEFVEWAIVYGQYKGISKAEIQSGLDSGKDVLLRINVDGVQTVKALYPQSKCIFITVEDEEELWNRLNHRGTDSEEDKLVRKAEIHREHQYIKEADFVVYNHNGKFDQTMDEVRQIIKTLRNEG